MDLNNSADLFTACSSDDTSTQTVAYEVLWAYLFRVACQMVYDQPEAEALAQNCAQLALVRIHQRLAECREPATFRAWARRIVSHLVIDELRRRKRLVRLDESGTGDETSSALKALEPPPTLEEATLEATGQLELGELIRRAPISDRSLTGSIGQPGTDTATDGEFTVVGGFFANEGPVGEGGSVYLPIIIHP